MKKRILFVSGLLICLAGMVVWRLVEVQILQRDLWSTRARSMHKRKVEIQPDRGLIFDRDGRSLAMNTKGFDIAIDSMDMTKPEILVDILSEELNRGKEEIRSLIYRKSYFTWISRGVGYEIGRSIRNRANEMGVQGLIFMDSSRRLYPRNELAGNILGFTGVDGQGLAGVEYSMDQRLIGKKTVKNIMYGADRSAYREKILEEGRPGYDIYLTLDTTFQYITREALQWGVKKFRAKGGWAVVMDPDTGKVLAMSQDQVYDPNRYYRYDPGDRRIKPVSYTFEPGSILKVFTGLAALENGVVDPGTMVNGDSPVKVANHRVSNALYRDWGAVTFSEVLEHSINTGIIRIARKLGESRLYSFLSDVGFGREVGIELPGEESGKLRPLSQWSKLAIGSIPIGQSISVTSIQLASKMAAVANGGRIVYPTIVDKIVDPRGEEIYLPSPPTEKIASSESINQMKDILRKVVKDGSGQNADIPGWEVCGKTGTAQKARPTGGYYDNRYISSFAGFFPKGEPDYLILVVLNEVGTEPVWGGETAAKVFKRIGEKIIALPETEVPP